LLQTLEKGPALLVLFAPPAPQARLRELAAAQLQFGAAGLRVIAIRLGPGSEAISDEALPLVVGVSSDAVATLELFRAADDGGETELMLDRAGGIHARWTRDMPGGLAPPDTLAMQAEHIAQTAVATPSHMGHTD
jgi:hypothetical protein